MASFLKITCPDCKNEQVVFESTSQKVKCKKCNKVLAEPTGGKAKLLVKSVEKL